MRARLRVTIIFSSANQCSKSGVYAPEIVVAIIDDHEAIRVGMSAALRASGRFVGVREGAATVGEFWRADPPRPGPTLPMSCCWI